MTGPVWDVDTLLAAPLNSAVRSVVAEVGGSLAPPVSRILSGTGKRLRPRLTLMVASLGRGADPLTSGALDRAAAVELLHCATLIHDDLLDGAAIRRGVPTLNAREGVGCAVVGGDLLIAAAGLLASRASQRAGTIVAGTLAKLCQGEYLQAQLLFDPDADEATLLRLIGLKTGSLLQAACTLGADAAGLDAIAQNAVGLFGMHFGIALQLVDDLMDVLSSAALARKPVGVDFTTGVVTLPAVFAMAEQPELRSLLRPDIDDVSRRRALCLLRDPVAVHKVLDRALAHAVAAESALQELVPDHPGLYVLSRWPTRYVLDELRDKVDRENRHLISIADVPA